MTFAPAGVTQSAGLLTGSVERIEGQDEAPPGATGVDGPALERVNRPLEVHFTPGVMFTRLVGEGRMAPASHGPRIDFADSFDLGGGQAIPNFELTIRRDETYDLMFGGSYFSSSGAGAFEGNAVFGPLEFRDGDGFRSEFRMTNAFMEFGYALRPLLVDTKNIREDGRPVADLRLSPLAGMRYVDIDHRVEHEDNGRLDTGGEWVGVYGGVKLELTYRPEPLHVPWMEMLDMHATVGVGRSLDSSPGYLWHVRSGVTWHITEQAGVQLGYRLMDLDVDRGSYRFKGGLQGLFLGMSLRF